MSDVDRSQPHAAPMEEPARHGLPWKEEDFAALVQACRGGGSIEELARSVGRTPGSVRMQLRRLLPLDERHLPAELALPRLRQLDRDGTYDWLDALAHRTKSAWQVQHEARIELDARGIGFLTDDELLLLLLAMVSSTFPTDGDLRQRLAGEVRRRGLEHRLQLRVARAADAAVQRVLGAPRWDWGYEEPQPDIDREDEDRDVELGWPMR